MLVYYWVAVCYKQMERRVRAANMAAHCCAANCIKECITLAFIILLSHTLAFAFIYIYFSQVSPPLNTHSIYTRRSRSTCLRCGCWCGCCSAVFICVNYFIAGAQQQCTMHEPTCCGCIPEIWFIPQNGLVALLLCTFALGNQWN